MGQGQDKGDESVERHPQPITLFPIPIPVTGLVAQLLLLPLDPSIKMGDFSLFLATLSKFLASLS